MLLYNWRVILKTSSGKAKDIVDIVDSMMWGHIPRNSHLYKYNFIDFSGLSFLYNAYELIRNRQFYTDLEIANYIGLASYRSLAEYKLSGIKTLDMSLSPMDHAQIKNNRLLRVEDEKVIFKYEDYTKEN